MAVRTGLSPAELDQIRETLTAGRRPKVVFTRSAGQIAGQQGQVVALTDPAVDDEWLVVRFGRDELPFSPTDLAVAPRGAPAKRAAKAAPPAPVPAPAPPGPPLLPPPAEPVNAVPTPREEITVTRPASPAKAASKTAAAKATTTRTTTVKATGRAGAAAGTPGGDGKAAGEGKPAPADNAATAPVGEDPPARPAAAPARPPARKAGRGKAPATLTVTLTYADGEWMVAAQQGSRSLAKPYVIRASEALKMVGMLDVPGVHEAVEEIVSSARAEAEAAAEKLRAELAEVEARLAELRDAT